MASALRRSIPVRTLTDWRDPGATSWTECTPLLVCEQTLPSTVLTELRDSCRFRFTASIPTRIRVHKRDAEGVLRAVEHCLHALPTLPQERPGICRTEERNRGPTDGWLSQVGGRFDYCGGPRGSTFSSPACERLGKRAHLDGPADPRKRSGVVVALIRSFRRPHSCRSGSRPSRGELAPSS